jgi:GT2 family glycosyltransferase
MTCDVAVVVPAHNGRRYTEACLRALHGVEGEFAMIVVDDGSTDGTESMIRERWPHVDVVRGNGLLWWSGSVNLGCRRAIERGAKVVVLLNNDDVGFSNNLVTRLAFHASTREACVSAVAVDRAPNPDGLVLQAGGTLSWGLRGAALKDVGVRYQPTSDLVPCDWLPGNALAFTVSIFKSLGGFDARRFPQYRGDADFTLRARRSGIDCFVARDCWVVNDTSQTGLNFRRRVKLAEFLGGLVSLRSSYNLRETIGFALRHCPRKRIGPYLAFFYARYTYAFLKSLRLPAASGGN